MALPSRRAAPASFRNLRAGAAALTIACALGAAPVAWSQVNTVDGPRVVPAEFNGDLSKVPAAPEPVAQPFKRPVLRPPGMGAGKTGPGPGPSAPGGGPRPPMPATIQNFPGMNFNDACTGGRCGGGWPPDPNGDVGPNHYIEAVNTAYAIYSKTGTLLASFTENFLWSAAASPPCTGASDGDPIVVYDPLADRWILTHFAFSSLSGPFFQCFAISKTGDPVTGGWWLYALRMDPGGVGLPPVGTLNDYPKFGIWHDCLYMSANEFTSNATAYGGVAVASLSRADMYNGLPLTWALGYLPYPANNIFGLVPSNSVAKGANAVAPGTPNYFVSESQSLFTFEVRKFTAGPNCGGGGSLGAPVNVSQASYTFQAGNIVPQPNTTNTLDMIDDRIMQKVQYRKVGAAESLWVTHPVGTGVGNQVAMQWAQIDVTGGTVATTPVQQQIHSPDTTLYRFMGSLAVDNQGNMALGYSTSNGTAPNFPSLAYAGRLAGDPLNTLPQTEAVMLAGAGSQTNICGGSPCDRWGDYSAMSVDPVDDCTFWYTNEYYSSQANGNIGNWQNRIGSFKFPGCTAPASTAQRTFVASNGNDLNPCTIASPCRSFGAAIIKTSTGGEVIVLDSAGYGPVVITKPVSIIAPPGVYAGVTVFGGAGIAVNPVVGKVTLRGLTINALGGTIGIDYQSGDALYLDNVVVSGFPTAGLNVLAAATGTVQVHDSTFRNNGIGATFGTTGATTATLKVSIDNSQFDGNTTGVRFNGSSALGEIRRSTLSGGTTGALLQPTVVGAVSRVDFIESTITKNAGSGVQAGGVTGTTNVSLTSSLVSGNGTGVQASTGGAVMLSDSTVTRNATGLATPSGTIASGAGNRLYNNTSNGSFSSTTPKQ